MLRGKIGALAPVFDEADAMASVIVDATGITVSRKQPSGTQRRIDVSVPTMPAPVGSRCTTNQS